MCDCVLIQLAERDEEERLEILQNKARDEEMKIKMRDRRSYRTQPVPGHSFLRVRPASRQ